MRCRCLTPDPRARRWCRPPVPPSRDRPAPSHGPARRERHPAMDRTPACTLRSPDRARSGWPPRSRRRLPMDQLGRDGLDWRPRRPASIVLGKGTRRRTDPRSKRVVEMGTAGEDVTLGREHEQRGPVTQPVPVGDVGTTVGIDADRDRRLGDGGSDVRTSEHLCVDTCARRRPRGLEQQQHRPTAALRLEECRRVPRLPVDGRHGPIMACRWLIGSRSSPETASGQRSAPRSCASSRRLASSSNGKSTTPVSRPWSSPAARCHNRCWTR